MYRTIWKKMMFMALAVLCLSTTGVRAANILYVTAEDDPLDADDAPVVRFLQGLGHTLILIDDNEDQATTRAAALQADVVFISESVGSGEIKNEITDIETPIIVAEAWAWDEMGLTSGGGGGVAVASTDIQIVKPGHFLAAGLRGTVPVLKSTGSARLGMGIAGDRATVIARATLSDGRTYDVIYVYEKGAALPVAPANGSAQVAAGMRICFGFDELSLAQWNDKAYALLEAAVNYAIGATNQALNPDPSDEQEDVSRDVILSWTPWEGAQSHRLYLGTTFEDVNSADAGSPLLVGPGLDANTFDPGRLGYGQTYYWRVDEIGTPPASKISKGNVWSFTVEPLARPITADSITATASSSLNADSGPEKTVDTSGLNASDQHDTPAASMWTSAVGQQPPVWIQYEFDRVYLLDHMWVWNSNNTLEWLAGLGVKTATMEYSTDGATWTALANVPQFSQAPGTANYVHNTTVDFGGVAAQFVRITCTSSWSERAQYGLSEVRFFAIPLQARDPEPATGTANVSPDVTLSWRAGREAVSHQVYLGTDPNALTLAGTASVANYAPAGLLLGTRYYWRVDEVNTAEAISTWAGPEWSFTTAAYLVVDDMESYTDAEPDCIYNAWADGFVSPGVASATNGALVGYDSAPFAEKTTTHGGSKQSMPFRYGQSTAPTSEATRTFAPAQDWTRLGVKTLVIYFHGLAANTTGQLYVKINGTQVAYSGAAGDLAADTWTQWNIELPAAVGLGAVQTLTIGVSGGQGTLYFDDIRLYQSAP